MAVIGFIACVIVLGYFTVAFGFYVFLGGNEFSSPTGKSKIHDLIILAIIFLLGYCWYELLSMLTISVEV